MASAAPPAPNAKPIEAAAVKLGRPVDFEKDVSPIFESNCLACHNVGISESKLSVETAETIRKGGNAGRPWCPRTRRPASSFSWRCAGGNLPCRRSPIRSKPMRLSPRELGILKQWILEGAQGAAAPGHDTIQWQPIPPAMKSIECVALSPWGRFAAAGRTNQVVIYDLNAGRETARLTDPLLSGLTIDGRPMYPGGAADRDFIHALAFSPDGSLLAAGGYRDVKLWKRPTNVRKWTVPLPEKLTALAVNQAGSLVAVAMADKTIALVPAAGQGAVRKLTGPAEAVTALEFSADGKRLYAGSLDRTWRAWTVSDGTARGSVTTPAPVNALALNKEGTELFTGGADGVIRRWSRSAEKTVAIREWKAHAKAVTSLALVLPAGTQLVSGSQDGTVRVWDIATGKETRHFEHGGPVTAVAVRPDGQAVAAAGSNKLARLWRWPTANCWRK